MASITKKKVGRHLYYYARECRRVNGRPKIVWQHYLGRLDDIVAAVRRSREGSIVPEPLQQALVVEMGATAALYDLCIQIGLLDTIDKYVPKRGSGPSVGLYLSVAVINRCVKPLSKAQIGEWFDGTVLRRLVDIKSDQLTSQRFWDNMDRVSPEAIGLIENEITTHVIRRFKLEVSRLLFDATNFFTFIDTFNEKSTLAQRGKCKQERASLRIVGLAMLVTADFHVPLLHHTYPGNQTDAPTFASLTEAIVGRCQALADGVEHITIVFDKGNNSKANLEAVEATPYHFVGSLVPTQHPELLAVPRRDLRSLADEGLPGVSAYRTHKVVFGKERTILVTWNENLFVSQCRTLLREIGKRQQRLAELVARLHKRRTGEVQGGKPPTVEGTRKTVDGWLKARHMKALFEVTVTENGGLPAVSYRFVQEAWDKLQGELLGKTIIFTDNDDWTDAEIVRGYRSQHHIESAFRQMKDPQCIALRPQHHWTDNNVRVHVFTCVLALILVSLLRRTLHAKGIDLSIPRILELLGGIKEVTMLFPPEGDPDGEPVSRTSLTALSAEQRQLYEALDLRRYAHL
jgi:transposase